MKRIIFKTGQNILKRMNLLLIIISLTGFSGCENNDVLTLNQLDQIDFEVITMEDGIEGTNFNTGSDITFALKIINRSGKDFKWYYDYGCIISNQEDFLLVKKKILIQTELSNITYVPVGKPYQSPVNCPAINLPPQLIAPGEERILIGLLWSDNPDNTALTTGEHFTEFTLSLTIEGRQKSWNLRTDFIIR